MIKLAGGIFHTHHHLADARQEILISIAVQQGISNEFLDLIYSCSSIEECFLRIKERDKKVVDLLYKKMVQLIEEKSVSYVNRYLDSSIQISPIVFDKKREIVAFGNLGLKHIKKFDLRLQS